MPYKGRHCYALLCVKVYHSTLCISEQSGWGTTIWFDEVTREVSFFNSWGKEETPEFSQFAFVTFLKISDC